MPPKLKTRKPTGAVPWPLILLEGSEKAGKSWAAAEFTADPRLGTTYWIDLGEGAADEYAAIPGANYEVIVHDGTWADIIGQVEAVHAEAARAAAAKEKPVVLVIDSMTAEWDMLKDYASAVARSSPYAKRILANDPAAEVRISNSVWNTVNARHDKLKRLIMQFPGIVIVTARGKEVAVIGADGNPVQGEKTWRVEAQKSLGYDASAWVRLRRNEQANTIEKTVVGCRSVFHGLQAGVDKPRPVENFTVAWLIFDVLKCDPNTAFVRDMPALDTTAPPVPDHGDYDAPGGYDDRAEPQRPTTRPNPQQQGGMAGLGAQLDPAAAFGRLVDRVNAATDKAELLHLHGQAPSVLPADRVAEAQALIIARASELGLIEKPAPAGPAAAPTDTAADAPAPVAADETAPVDADGEQQTLDGEPAAPVAEAANS